MKREDKDKDQDQEEPALSSSSILEEEREEGEEGEESKLLFYLSLAVMALKLSKIFKKRT